LGAAAGSFCIAGAVQAIDATRKSKIDRQFILTTEAFPDEGNDCILNCIVPFKRREHTLISMQKVFFFAVFDLFLTAGWAPRTGYAESAYPMRAQRPRRSDKRRASNGK
jgi:hypothetical protein